jgi:DNA mismatch repair protein MutL
MTFTTIQKLPLDVINTIAAGEVIDSIAAVVRELVENSLDAGANRVTISLYPEIWRIRVADNGKGMSREDLCVCANAHSTSKIASKDDLWSITSLGFRGEALHSIVRVADLEIFSRQVEDSEGVGWRIVYKDGELVLEEVAAIATGTIVNVSNLFASLPVRRKALPSLSQQLKGVQNLIYNLALTHPQITWQVWQDDRPWFHIAAATDAKGIIPQIVRQVETNDLQSLQLEVETPLLNSDNYNSENIPKSQIELVIGLPDRCHRNRMDWLKIAVNGRLVRLPELEQTIISAFARTLPRDRYPLCFFHLTTDPRQIDWNRHPAKTEIYLNSIDFWRDRLDSAIERALRIDPDNLTATFQNQRVKELLKVAENKGTYHLDNNNSDNKNFAKKASINLIELTAVAQVNQTYIVAEHPNGLWLIEQHIAHERVIYEQLQENWEIVLLETPIVLNNLTQKQREQLNKIGLEIDPFGEQLWAVRNAPKMLTLRQDCAEALLELSQGGDLQTAQVATACRSAIRNGTPLNLTEMQNLIDLWKNTKNPRTCPHGRPIYLSLEESSLARFFRRHWVIGKSHGIRS